MPWLLLITPEADPLVAPWRAEHDWAARHGIPAHVTVRTPFLEPAEWPDAAPAELASRIPVRVRLSRLEVRPGALVVLAEPDDELRELTTLIGETWPALPRHKEAFDRPLYHVTVARTPDPALRRRAAEAIAPHLPLEVGGTELWATAGSPEAGVVRRVLSVVS